MQMNPLGRTGVSVSALCYGTMCFGREADEAESARMYAACRDKGINFFDCANVYSNGRAEEILGRLIAHEREELVITTKCGMGPDGINTSGGSRRHVTRSVEASLTRLGTDRVDVLFMHRWDDGTPVEETLRALEDLVRAGKVLYLGASNYAAWQVAKALGISARMRWSRFEVIQPMYNLVKRQAEVELLPLALSEGLSVTPYSPLGGGLLTGKYRTGGAGSRLDTDGRYARRYGEDWMKSAATSFADLAEAEGVDPVTLAIAWVMSHPAVTAPLIGARSADQLASSLAAADLVVPHGLLEKVTSVSPTPPPATDRIEERV
ncbi:MAG: aldo/keto reductase [Pseudomonadota bacterium]